MDFCQTKMAPGDGVKGSFSEYSENDPLTPSPGVTDIPKRSLRGLFRRLHKLFTLFGRFDCNKKSSAIVTVVTIRIYGKRDDISF